MTVTKWWHTDIIYIGEPNKEPILPKPSDKNSILIKNQSGNYKQFETSEQSRHFVPMPMPMPKKVKISKSSYLGLRDMFWILQTLSIPKITKFSASRRSLMLKRPVEVLKGTWLLQRKNFKRRLRTNRRSDLNEILSVNSTHPALQNLQSASRYDAPFSPLTTSFKKRIIVVWRRTAAARTSRIAALDSAWGNLQSKIQTKKFASQLPAVSHILGSGLKMQRFRPSIPNAWSKASQTWWVDASYWLLTIHNVELTRRAPILKQTARNLASAY